MTGPRSSIASILFLVSLAAAASAQSITCPGASDAPVQLAAGQVTLAKSSTLCLLIKAVADEETGQLAQLAPVARSFDGLNWRKSGGGFATKLLRGLDFEHDGDDSTIDLPALSGVGEQYYLKGYDYSASDDPDRARDIEIARFLNTATFGATASEIFEFPGNLTKETASDWVASQLNETATSHRAYLRKRVNTRMTSPRDQFIPDHPCDKGSRWRSYTFTKQDGHQWWYQTGRNIGLKGDGPYVITFAGHARTTVDEFPWKKHWLNIGFDQSKEYDVKCTHDYQKVEEWIGGNYFLKNDYGRTCQAILNPPIYFDLTKTTLPNPVVPLPALGEGLELIDTHILESAGQHFILANGLEDDVCSMLPDVHDEKEPPIFGQMPDGTWLQFDPHVDVEENTVENPLPDGGGMRSLITNEISQCSNVRRNMFNEHGCVLSHEPTSCAGTYNTRSIPITLNADSIDAIYKITGLYLYIVYSIPLTGDDPDAAIPSPCKPGQHSRWQFNPASDCQGESAQFTLTTLDPATETAIRNLIENTKDWNPVVFDTYTPSEGLTCHPDDMDILGRVNLLSSDGTQCYIRTHPDNYNIFDMTDCTHPENPCGFTSWRNPIVRKKEGGQPIYFNYRAVDQPFWDSSRHHLKKIGRLTDTVMFRDLSNEMRLDEVAKYFGGLQSSGGESVVVCGSRNEVSNDPSLGSLFGLEIWNHDNSGAVLNGASVRENVFFAIALHAKDQLRQRVAWALSQIVVVVPDQVESGWIQSENFLHFYDTFVEHAFGSYRDILKEITYSPMMAENLSFLNSKSGGYLFETQGKYAFADENFSREIMQLFSIGLILLNDDGTEKVDENGIPIAAYTNDEIMSMARIFTGFVPPSLRGNTEEAMGIFRNALDETVIDPVYHDRFPKHDLTGGYIGDGYPLCVDLPDKMFLRKGAVYRLLGNTREPQAFEDSPYIYDDGSSRVMALDETSMLRKELCKDVNETGSCTYPMTVTLSSNLNCTGQECDADELRVIQVGSVFYEYWRPACVEQVFFNDAIAIKHGRGSIRTVICANPKLAHASETCVTNRKKWTKIAVRYLKYNYDTERVKYATGQDRCARDGWNQGHFHYMYDIDKFKLGFQWTDSSCKIRMKVDMFGLVSIVHRSSDADVNVRNDNNNYFKVYWDGDYPKNDLNGSCGSACTPLDDGGCLCDVTVSEVAVFTSLPSSDEEVLSNLYIGAFDPTAYDDGTYTTEVNGDIIAYHKNGVLSSSTIFEVTDKFGRVRLLKNSKETVGVVGSPEISFRSVPDFISLINEEAAARDVIYEVDAMLDHLFYHDNTAPFIAKRLIQHFTTSNPDPSYVKAVVTAFRTGKYESIGSGQYGDLSAAIAAVLLEPDALSVVLDADPFHGSVREPLMKVISFLRSMEVELSPNRKAFKLSTPFVRNIGQMAHSFPSVFSFFLPEYVPSGRVGLARLTSPESMLSDMPKIVGMLNGLYSTIKYGVSPCNNGFGKGKNLSNCVEGDYSNAAAKLSFARPSVPAEDVVEELDMLLTNGRLSAENKQILVNAYNSKLPDEAAALRMVQQLIVSSPEFHTSNAVRPSGSPRSIPESPPPKGVPYKAIVYLMLAGGADSFNMLVPHTCAQKDMYTEYADIRTTIAIPKRNLLPIDATSSNQVCEQFGINPHLPTVQKLYNEGDLLWFANAGVLTQPVDKSNYRGKTRTQLFAHNRMQAEIQHVDPFEEDLDTGVMGRVSDALMSEEGMSVERFNIFNRAEGLEGRYGSDPYIIDAHGVPAFNEDASSVDMFDLIKEMNAAADFDSGVFADLWSESLLSSIKANDLLTEALENVQLSSSFGSDSYGKSMEMISKLIATRDIRGVDRDIFYFSVSGWDAHKKLSWNEGTNLPLLDGAIAAFSNEMKSMGIWDGITVIQMSDFGRTLPANGGDGSDHAWGGNYMMMGGTVRGGQVLGTYPDVLTDDGPLILQRGRVIPTTSWDVIFAGIAEWAGVPSASLGYVCPNLDKFPESSRFTMAQLFETL